MTRKALLILLLGLFAAVTTVQSQDPWVYPGILARIASGQSANAVQTAVSTHQVLLIKYIGTNATGGTVTVAAGGQISLATGPVGGSVASTATECPIVAPLGGIIDVTNGACNTLGAVVDAINGDCTGCSKTEWRAVILDGLRSDSSNNTLATLAETNAAVDGGVAALGDTAVTFDVMRALVPREFRSIEAYLQPGTNTFKADPFAGYETVVSECHATSTHDGAATDLVINADRQVYSTTVGSAVEETLWSEPAGATTVNKVFDFQPGMLWSGVGKKLVARLANASAMTVPTLVCNARMYKAK